MSDILLIWVYVSWVFEVPRGGNALAAGLLFIIWVYCICCDRWVGLYDDNESKTKPYITDWDDRIDEFDDAEEQGIYYNDFCGDIR